MLPVFSASNLTYLILEYFLNAVQISIPPINMQQTINLKNKYIKTKYMTKDAKFRLKSLD
jgi:hypothetical protein